MSDKLKHFVVCTSISLLTMVLMRAVSVDFVGACIAGLLCAVAAGGGKEFGDNANPYNCWDWRDILADVAGAVVGILTGSILWV